MPDYNTIRINVCVGTEFFDEENELHFDPGVSVNLKIITTDENLAKGISDKAAAEVRKQLNSAILKLNTALLEQQS